MNDSIGNAMLLSIVLFILTAVMLLFVGTLAYSKAFKAKNVIINNLESYKTYAAAETEINNSLTTLGYQRDEHFDCPKVNEKEAINDDTFKYCVYEYRTTGEKYYYKVITYTQFNFPIVGKLVTTKVSGETKILGKKYNYD